jgi:diol dehydratase reactivase alpha subunit
MKIIAGIDVGNSTTEACIAKVSDNGKIEFLKSGIAKTTGIKGTIKNVEGILAALKDAVKKLDNFSDIKIDLIRINEAAPVIGDTAMETITETIITESTMIGHNPLTPGGLGLGIGIVVPLEAFRKLERLKVEEKYIVVVADTENYESAAEIINRAKTFGIDIRGAIVQKDEGVLINNRLSKKIPIVDEVSNIEKVPLYSLAAVEVADMGHSIKTLSNPYGIASIFSLSGEETKQIIPVAKSLIGTRSAVVIKTPKGEVKEKIIPAGKLYLQGKSNSEIVDIDQGAEEIMSIIARMTELEDVEGETNTNIGVMINNVKFTMSEITGNKSVNIKIRDLLAVDTYLPVKVTGGLAGETFMEKAVAIAVMVKTDKLPMLKVAESLYEKLGNKVKIAGNEAVMAVMGALTTPGTKLPLAVLDLGGGSTDAAIIDEKGIIHSTHLAGAGELVTMLINSELNLQDRNLAEEIKKYPVAKVESLFHIRIENREIKFFSEPLEAKYFGRTVILKDNELIPIYNDVALEKIVEIRKAAKEKVFVENALRALKIIAPMNNLRNISSVVLVGGSALDFEISDMIFKALAKYKIVAGRGNIRGSEGPRNAVATGLVISHVI